ncbi:MAG: MATE family efflux transporter [Spirochaetaceae bacterium]|jgi:putative MATE family efflux protein|nr:MATE family efflux transporter [Spirochaetaceae bacterium]
MVKDKKFYTTLAQIALPLAMQNLITYGIGLADNFMVGSLGDLSLSGVFLSNQVQWLLFMLCTGLGAAMVVLAAQYLGKKDVRNAKVVIAITLKIALGIGGAATLLVFLFPAGILNLFTRDEGVVAEGMRYIRIVCFSYIFFSVNSVLLASMRCVQNTRIGFLSSLTGFLVNVFLNWVLIFGKLGMPALGVSGAAIATVIARIAECGVTFCHVRFIDKNLLLRIKDLALRNREITSDFFRYGIPVILGDIIWGIAGSTQVAILGRLGTEVLAANTIAANLFQFFSVMVYGIANASGIIVGRTVGSGDYQLVKTYSKTLQLIFLGFGLLTGLLIFFSKDLILAAGFPNISAEAHAYARQFLIVFSITIVGTSYQMSVLTGIVRAGGATSFVLINDLIHVWIIVIPSALLAARVFHSPPVVVFFCLKSDQLLKCIVAVIKLNRWNWMRKLTREG